MIFFSLQISPDGNWYVAQADRREFSQLFWVLLNFYDYFYSLIETWRKCLLSCYWAFLDHAWGTKQILKEDIYLWSKKLIMKEVIIL